MKNPRIGKPMIPWLDVVRKRHTTVTTQHGGKCSKNFYYCQIKKGHWWEMM